MMNDRDGRREFVINLLRGSKERGEKRFGCRRRVDHGPEDPVDVGDSPLRVGEGVVEGGWIGVDCLSALVLRTELRAWGEEGRDGIGVTRAGVPGTDRLWIMCDLTRLPAANADIKLNSPAMTEAQMILASR